MQSASLIPRLLQDMQNRGQLSAGMSRFNATPDNGQLLDTYREIGTVQEVFRLSHSAKAEALMKQYATTAVTLSLLKATTLAASSGSRSPSTANWQTIAILPKSYSVNRTTTWFVSRTQKF